MCYKCLSVCQHDTKLMYAVQSTLFLKLDMNNCVHNKHDIHENPDGSEKQLYPVRTPEFV